MPIPPRPIPTPAPRRAHTPSTAAKPGSSLPRRGLYFMDHADMYDLPLPSSLPVKGLSGVTVVKQKPEVKVPEGRRMEVGVSELVMDGLGKREKRGEWDDLPGVGTRHALMSSYSDDGDFTRFRLCSEPIGPRFARSRPRPRARTTSPPAQVISLSPRPDAEYTRPSPVADERG